MGRGARSSGDGRRLAAWVLALLPALAPAGAGALDPSPSPCPRARDAVVVVTDRRELWLCRGGIPAAQFAVALGRSGVGKRRHGDGRTPLGTYPLGDPRPSTQYGTFIPIAYPTPAQAARGFTGAAVGIHGPPRGTEGYPVTEVDWTQGCIATGTDEDVDAIAAFVRARRPRLVIR
ncbi:ErfK/YbiS/YcfS/YnhG family protein [Anaeromyxobacter dehalogenans 2CP-1]|uniref:ErfK/YbiS/YcfS/YnhG family protein n=1 Tax=Anaeromyxobacter dehalogenans (strain ATCC BAA-258 / DSM 21875 / 2CP-1) TaxID=455488 RepID=B8JG36_ANAD2|nr:L,D-transpeptidase family protein [Anaeromyxobacter dehalogenans]ACL66439.1 ErfK/YbiS/YcfS/YnhG family protein [Anaeromyxobacter dehalogenans 2CP-1]